MTSYFPIEQGSLYVYDGEGNEYAPFERKFSHADGNLVQFHESNGGSVVVYVYRVQPDEARRVEYIPENYSLENRIPAIKQGHVVQEEDEIILQTPLQVGHAWVTNGRLREIVSVSEIVSVPFGEFRNVLKVRVHGPEAAEWQNYEYYARGVGLIKREFTSESFYVSSYLSEVHR